MSKNNINLRGNPREAFDTTVTQGPDLGTRMYLPDGRVFRYAKAGSTALVIGKLVQAPENDLDVANVAVASIHFASALNTLTVTVALRANIQLDDFKDGIAFVNDGAGEGQLYHINGHASVLISETSLKLYIDSPIQVTHNTGSKVTIFKNKYNGVNIVNFSPVEPVVGVPISAIIANYFFWLQVAGPATVLQQGKLWNGRQVAPSNTVSGAIRTFTNVIPDNFAVHSETGTVLQTVLDEDAGGVTEERAYVTGAGVIPDQVVGTVLDARADTEFCLVSLNLDV